MVLGDEALRGAGDRDPTPKLLRGGPDVCYTDGEAYGR